MSKGGYMEGGGRPKGAKNKKTIQWEVFSEYCLNGGLEKLEKELNKLKGKDYVNAYFQLLEYHKPKLARTEVTGVDGEKMQIEIVTRVIESK